MGNLKPWKTSKKWHNLQINQITYLETVWHNDLKLSWFWISAPQATMYTTAPRMNLMNGVNSSEKTYIQFQGV